MKLQVGDLFLIKGTSPGAPAISFIITDEHIITEEHIFYFNVIMYYPDGNIKNQTLDADVIEHYIENEGFVHYPVKQ